MSSAGATGERWVSHEAKGFSTDQAGVDPFGPWYISIELSAVEGGDRVAGLPESSPVGLVISQQLEFRSFFPTISGIRIARPGLHT